MSWASSPAGVYPVPRMIKMVRWLLTDRCRWLTFELDKVRENSLEEITVAHVTVYDKTKGRTLPFTKATVFDAYNEFEKCRMGTDSPKLKILPPARKKDEPLLGIITLIFSACASYGLTGFRKSLLVLNLV